MTEGENPNPTNDPKPTKMDIQAEAQKILLKSMNNEKMTALEKENTELRKKLVAVEQKEREDCFLFLDRYKKEYREEYKKLPLNELKRMVKLLKDNDQKPGIVPRYPPEGTIKPAEEKKRPVFFNRLTNEIEYQ